MVKYIAIIFLTLLLGCNIFTSRNEELQLQHDLSISKIDSLIKKSAVYYSSNIFADSIFDKYLLAAELIAQNNNLPKQQIKIYNIVGKRFRHVAEFGHAIILFQKSHSLATKINDGELKAYSLHNMAVAFRRIDDNAQALKLHFKTLEWAETVKDTFLILSSQNGIGNVYLSYNDYVLAKNYFHKSLDILHKVYNNKLSEAINNNNIGDCWLMLGEYDSARYYLEKSYQINIEIGSIIGQAICKNGLGNISLQTGNYNEAIEFYNTSLELNIKKGKQYYIANNLKNLGKAYTQLNNFNLADKMLKEGLAVSKEIGSKAQAFDILNNLSKLYSKFGKTPEALNFLNEALIHKDSITKEVTRQNVEGMNAIYKSEKQEREIVILRQRAELDQLLMNRQRGINIAALALFSIGFFVAIFIYRQLKVKQRYSKTTENQHKNITDSIKYAEKIQTAMIPSFDSVANRIDDYFVLFRPRNIVSGDFYWTTYLKNRTIIATADCTGHGVPGALMSMLGVSLLNEIVNNNGILKPNQILDRLREQLIKQLHQKGEENTSKDGMDISIYSIDHENMKIHYSGSYIPLYIIRNNNFIILEADKMPIGYHWKKNKPFAMQEIDLQKGDCIYSSSDGYYDQFGGEHKSKFLIKNFKELLLKIHKEPMTQQEVILNNTLDEWKGNFEQIDDIVVIGLRV